VNELGKYLQSRDPAMAGLAVSSLKRMKEDDSRRISSLAEKFLVEFEETHAQKEKADSSKITPEIKSATGRLSDEELSVPAKIITENEPVSLKATSQPISEQAAMPVDRTSEPKAPVLDSTFWSKWIGTAIVAVVLILTVYYYDYSVGVSDRLYGVILFAIVTGSSSLIQWFVFRDRLKVWWIGANTVAGMLLGWLHIYLFDNSGWGKEHLLILSSVWILYNFALGPTLMREAQGQTSQTLPAEPHTELLETVLVKTSFFCCFQPIWCFPPYIHSSLHWI
jgi:hypothetical protein